MTKEYTDRRKYYVVFDAYYHNNDAAPMINLIAGYVEDRLDKYLNVIR